MNYSFRMVRAIEQANFRKRFNMFVEIKYLNFDFMMKLYLTPWPYLRGQNGVWPIFHIAYATSSTRPFKTGVDKRSISFRLGTYLIAR